MLRDGVCCAALLALAGRNVALGRRRAALQRQLSKPERGSKPPTEQSAPLDAGRLHQLFLRN